MMSVKLYHSRPLLPWQRNLENLKTKVGYNSACIRDIDIADVLASNRGFGGLVIIEWCQSNSTTTTLVAMATKLGDYEDHVRSRT